MIYGRHAVLAALKNSKRKIEKIFIQENQKDLALDLLKRYPNLKNILKFHNVSTHFIDKIIQKKVKHQGVLALSEKLPSENYTFIFKNKTFKYGVILDSITDTNNVGAIYRSAKAFGLDFIVNSNKRLIIENGSLLNAACGAFETINSYTATNINAAIKKFKSEGWWVIGLDHKADNLIYEITKKITKEEKYVFIFGSEGKGIRKLIKENCNLIAAIPNTAHTNSINVSNAAAIVFYELFKNKIFQ